MTFAEAERLLLLQLEEEPEQTRATLRSLARLYGRAGRHDQAIARLRELFDLRGDPESMALFALAMGGHAEHAGDYPGAVAYYEETLRFKPADPMTAYFGNNNLGFSLNQLGRFVEGEACCRTAIPILPERPNAHKNLGLALAGQQRWREAAACYVEATRVCPSDPRSCALLEALVRDHPELEAEYGEMVQADRKAVGSARAWMN